MIRISALDDHPIIQEAYRSILNIKGDMAFVDGFTEENKLLEFLKKEGCDILLLDMHLGAAKAVWIGVR